MEDATRGEFNLIRVAHDHMKLPIILPHPEMNDEGIDNNEGAFVNIRMVDFNFIFDS